MTTLHNRFYRLGIAAASVLLLSAAPSLARSMPLPCSAFAHHAYGWKVLAPVMLDIDGRLLAPTVGTTFDGGSAMKGGRLNEMLNRECGNR
jgi:hypothetical protein